MQLILYTDGGSINNPGQAAYAYSIFQDNKPLLSFSKRIGVATNNVAEYMGVREGLKKIAELLKNNKIDNIDKICVKSDSALLVNQLNGLYKIKNATLRELILEIRIVEGEINLPIIYMHIYRESNAYTDSLVKKALTS